MNMIMNFSVFMTWIFLCTFGGGTYELSQYEISKSFEKAKKKALKRLEYELQEVQKAIDKVKNMTEETCPEIPNPYQ